ncbi:MAG: ABC transporter ATP-binding protein [bacterium]|nr:ABC transporter ATP-binding protein [bacterium]
MARIEFQDIAHSYEDKPSQESEWAIKPMNITWDDGGAYALLGPSGCGKTTLLNIISGLIQPTRGRVKFDDLDVTDLPTKEKNIAQVFQFPVIYDTMTVYDNLAFPLRNRAMGKQDIQTRVNEVARMLDLQSDLNRRASGLSADGKQKISLGRGLVRSDVAAILFDEPLTVIDPHVKWQLRRKLKEIHERFARTFIYVTHDQNEALTFADQVAVMNEGRILQVGTPQELFENPRHTFVGYFIGSPGMNLLPCRLDGNVAIVDGGRIQLDSRAGAHASNGNLELGIRPEFLKLDREKSEGAVEVAIVSIEDRGSFQIAAVQFGGQVVKVKLWEKQEISPGPGYLNFPPERTKLYADGQLLE